MFPKVVTKTVYTAKTKNKLTLWKSCCNKNYLHCENKKYVNFVKNLQENLFMLPKVVTKIV